jgi:hypothetical protein
MQRFKFCGGVESANTYFNIHLHMQFYLKKEEEEEEALFTYCKPDLGNHCKMNSIVEFCHI